MEKQKIKELENRILATLQKKYLAVTLVIEACETLAERVIQGAYEDFLNPLLKSGLITNEEIYQAVHLFSAKALLQKVERELGAERTHSYPLGVLFHVNPENMQGIAAYSVVEGLLSGNINLVKLPVNDYGMTEFLLRELIQIQPVLGQYIYLFSIRSIDKAMYRIASLADAVIIWGGDEAIQAVRAMVKPNQKVIEWGHKISFAYITKKGITDENMQALAKHITRTKQRLCSSCQGIYLDDMQKSEIISFLRRMNGFLSKEMEHSPEYNMIWTAQSTLTRYTYMLDRKVVMVSGGNGVSLLYLRNKGLEPAIGCGNVWVKSLNRKKLISALKMNHGYLQTVGLLCGKEEHRELRDIMIKAGVTNIRGAGDMSAVNPEDSHDGEYPLRRYTKFVL